MTDQTLLRSLKLDNGLTVDLWDCSAHYYGGYWRALIEVRCNVPVLPELFEDETAFHDAVRLLGATVPYLHRLEKMAVHQEQLEQTHQELVSRFEQHLLPSISKPYFPARFVSRELDERRKKALRGIPRLP